MRCLVFGGKSINTQHKHTRINDDIRVPMVRLIGEEGEQIGVVSIREALAKAAEVDLDLVEIVPAANPPVCKIMNHGKYLFQLNKKQSQGKKKQKQQVKKLRIRPGIEEGDYQVKLRNLTRFLTEGDRVEITLRFRGREMMHKELGLQLMRRICSDLTEHADVEREPKFEGHQQVMMILVPKKSGKE